MRRIFMAEDNPADVYMLDLALKESGAEFELEVTYTGKEALAFLEREKDSDKPPLDLILLDLNLPQHDGSDLLRYVRQDPPPGFGADGSFHILRFAQGPPECNPGGRGPVYSQAIAAA